ncbi:peptidylprolyl isomerase [Sphingomonas mucosissima]|uniref:Cyclophilin type peptidyl-prolyl cis-trans isomerase/CLD n=1 Tax=Sphingomonas mucosissima TaxID=370959 RepID=A0A245ZPM8_9SPHN|nr:peptidylprolyl isomerase [Sphingomonas mucosissima]OWK31685.1 cyclophilin type peptidyl-prolyl cis-trans isomerase/CLD [Sphingomonas mucosissima]
MTAFLLPLLLAQAAAAQASGRAAPHPQSPTEIVAVAPATDWVAIAPDDLLVMDVAPGPAGASRRIVIQLIAAPFARPWVANVRRLAAAHWWDGTSINRVQDNYVAQWGDATEKKPLPSGLAAASERDYAIDTAALAAGERTVGPADVYAPATFFYRSWPVGAEGQGQGAAWPVHCYGMVGVGRDVSPNTGTGAELYAVIGHAPRHLDRNIALVGRVIEGIEHLSSLPRGTLGLGFYDRAEQRVAIVRIRLASELPTSEQPRFSYLSTSSATWARYAAARANRQDAFFIRPAGAADICNLPVPIRRLR